MFNNAGEGVFWDFTGTQPALWFVEESDSANGPSGPFMPSGYQEGDHFTWNDVIDYNWYRVTAADADQNPIGPPATAVQYVP
jgi:hypothetical protein